MTTGNPFNGASFAGAVDLSALKARQQAPAAPNRESAPTSAGANVIDVSEATFQAEVLNRSMQVPVVLDLWAQWCEPCKQLSPVLEKLAAEGGGSWVLAKVDVDANQRLAQALRVQGIPAVKAIFQGQLVAEFSGAAPEPEVRKWITALVEATGGNVPAGEEEPAEEEEEDSRIVAAEEAIERGDLTEAARQYQDILTADPAHPLAGQALRQVQLLQRAEQHDGSDVIAKADAHPDDISAAFAAADTELASGDIDQGFSRLLNLVQRLAGDERDQVRDRLIELFALVGDDDPRVLAARRTLASALF